VVSTHLKNARQIGSFPQNRGKNKKQMKPPPGTCTKDSEDRHFQIPGLSTSQMFEDVVQISMVTLEKKPEGLVHCQEKQRLALLFFFVGDSVELIGGLFFEFFF